MVRAVKSALLRRYGYIIGRNLEIQTGLFIYKRGNLVLGSDCVIGANTQVWNYSSVKIGSNFLGSKNLTIISGTHDTKNYSNLPGPVEIGDRVWAGINVTICGPVSIGSDVIIAAGAVVVSDFPANVVIGGVPARILKTRSL